MIDKKKITKTYKKKNDLKNVRDPKERKEKKLVYYFNEMSCSSFPLSVICLAMSRHLTHYRKLSAMVQEWNDLMRLARTRENALSWFRIASMRLAVFLESQFWPAASHGNSTDPSYETDAVPFISSNLVHKTASIAFNPHHRYIAHIQIVRQLHFTTGFVEITNTASSLLSTRPLPLLSHQTSSSKMDLMTGEASSLMSHAPPFAYMSVQPTFNDPEEVIAAIDEIERRNEQIKVSVLRARSMNSERCRNLVGKVVRINVNNDHPPHHSRKEFSSSYR